MKKQLTALAVSGMLSMSAAFAGTVNPNTDVTTFQSGTAAQAAQVNANFTALINAINDNAQRIADLENATPDNSVAGKTYKIISFNTEMGIANDNSFTNIATGTFDGTITFDASNSTGTLTANADNLYEVNLPSNTLSDFSEPGLPASEPISFTQNGNNLTVTFSDGGSMDFVLTTDGSMLMGKNLETPAATTYGTAPNEIAGTILFNELIIGVRQ